MDSGSADGNNKLALVEQGIYLILSRWTALQLALQYRNYDRFYCQKLYINDESFGTDVEDESIKEENANRSKSEGHPLMGQKQFLKVHCSDNYMRFHKQFFEFLKTTILGISKGKLVVQLVQSLKTMAGSSQGV